MLNLARSPLSAKPLVPALLALVVLIAATWSRPRAEPKPDLAGLAVETIAVESRRIDHFLKSDPLKRSFGRLEFRGGLVLSSPSRNFGGWSGLEIDADGRRLVAVSDAGIWMTAELAYDGVKPTGLSNARLGPLLGTGGVPLVKEKDRDSEGVVLLDGTLSKGRLLISFERNHRIGRFPITDMGVGAPTGYLTLPPDARRQSPNKSLESVCIIRGGPNKGAVVALSERFPGRGDQLHRGWMQNPAAAQAAWVALAIRDADGFDLTDCRGLADGSLLVLERRFRWSSWYEGVKSRLRHFKTAEIVSGAAMEGEVLLDVDMDHEIDNLEGLGIHRGAQGETVLTMVSDNNFNSLLQRTVLLQFTLKGEGGIKSARQLP